MQSHTGTILGPLLFLLHINNMPQVVDCDLFLYADDTCLLYQHKDLDQINKEINIFVTYVIDLLITS